VTGKVVCPSLVVDLCIHPIASPDMVWLEAVQDPVAGIPLLVGKVED